MRNRTDALARALFNKPSLEACSLQQVDYLAHQYPYFSVGQLLLLQKNEASSAAAAANSQRAALHFSNGLQLNYWLNPSAFESELPPAQLFQKAMPEVTKVDVPPLAEELETIQSDPEPNEVAIEEESGKIAPATELITASIDEAENNGEAKAETAPEPLLLPTLNLQLSPPESTITFEPFHTVDYFASQGIKLSQQEATGDMLGKQVKSFTEWLKTMKRLPETVAPQATDMAGENKVENLAAHSLATADVVTEAMAEVWLKQGNKAKALELYRKLSLQNPSKSAYFAAKIESLKKS